MTDANAPSLSEVETDPHASQLRAVARRLAQPWLAPLVLSLTAGAMILWTRATWCDPIVDFGREIYVAWRLAAGDVLYRDIDYFNGPLSPYLNSLVFRLLGTSLLALQLANLLWWGALVVMAYRLYVIISDRLAAFVALFLFITLFSFLQLNQIANYNYICPYEHEATQALVCAFGMLTCLHVYLRSGNTKALAGCGLLLGAILLMKVEVALASCLALAVGIGLDLWARPVKGKGVRTLMILPVAAIVPMAGAFVLLRLGMPSGQALRGVLGAWKYLRDGRITDNRFYRHLTGTDAIVGNSLAMLRTFAVELGALIAGAIAAMLCRKSRETEGKVITAIGAAGVVLMATVIAWDQFGWQYAMRPLNLITALMVLGFGGVILRRPRDEMTTRLIMQMAFAVFALAMLVKLFFNVVIFHYGFTLAAPAFALLVMLLVSWIPQWIRRFNGTEWVFRAVVMTLLGAFLFRHLQVYQAHRSAAPIQTVGTGADQFSFYGRGAIIAEMIRVVGRNVPAEQTLACVPEGAMINYLTRRVNGTGELTLLPEKFFMFGKTRILDRFRAHPPDWIVTVQSNTLSFGFLGLGIDYGQDLFNWMGTHYRDVTPAEVVDPSFFMHLLRYDPSYATTRPAFVSRTPG